MRMTSTPATLPVTETHLQEVPVIGAVTHSA